MQSQGAVDPQLPDRSLASEGGAKKARNRRNKNNRHNAVGLEISKAEADWDMPLRDNSERLNVDEIWAGGWEHLDPDQSSTLQNSVQDSGVATTTNNTVVSNQCLKNEEGWELAGNRRSRRSEATPRNHGVPLQAVVRDVYSASKFGSASSATHCWAGDDPQPLRNSEVAGDRNVRRDGPVGGRQKVKPHASQNGCEEKWEKGKSSDGGTKSTKSVNNGLSGKWIRDSHQNGWGNPVDVAEPVKSPDAIGGWNHNGILPNNASAWQQKSTIGDFKSALINSAWGNTTSNIEEPHVLSKSLRSEKLGKGGYEPNNACAWQQKSPIGDFKSALVNRAWSNTTSNIEEPHVLSKSLASEKLGKAGYERNNNHKPVISNEIPSSRHSESICSGDDLDDDSDWVDSEGFDSDGSKVSHETRKKDKRLQQFFDTLAELNVDQLNDYDRQWHCPVCQGGVGAIDWFGGLQPLLAHANSVRTKKVKLHRNFAKTLEEEIRRRGTAWGQCEEIFGKWKGLREDSVNVNPFIVWPPTMIIQNTKLELDEQDKWIGMGNQELLDLFQQYNVVKARHAYGPQGHRGMGIVVFMDSPAGYYDALRLEKHFKDVRRGRENWGHPGKILFYEGGKRMLYGYMATAEDMEIFNKHSGKSKLKWGLKRLKEVVIEPMRQLNENNQQLNWLKQKEHSKFLEKAVSLVAGKLRLRNEEIRVIRERALEQHEENQKEIDELEFVYKNKIKQLVNLRTKREEVLQQKEEEFKQEQVRFMQQLENIHVEIPEENENGDSGQKLEQKIMEQEIACKSELLETSLKESEEYEAQKREIAGKHHAKRLEFMRQQYEQMLNFEKELEKESTELQEKYYKQSQYGESTVQVQQ